MSQSIDWSEWQPIVVSGVFIPEKTEWEYLIDKSSAAQMNLYREKKGTNGQGITEKNDGSSGNATGSPS